MLSVKNLEKGRIGNYENVNEEETKDEQCSSSPKRPKKGSVRER